MGPGILPLEAVREPLQEACQLRLQPANPFRIHAWASHILLKNRQYR